METELAQLSRTLNDAFDRIQAAYNRQTRFTADASHELRTPLSIILAHGDLILKGDRSQAEYRDALSAIRRAARRMKGVVDGLLALARADAGQTPLNREVLDLTEVIEEACLILAPLAIERQIAVSTDLRSASIVGDRHLISEAIGNLLINAIQYNRVGGRIKVTLRAQEGFAQLTVSDTGLGIPRTDQPHLFDRFYRVDKSRTHATGHGSGLGLAITKWVIESHGGKIEFTSEEGAGSEFVVTLLLGN
jgi:signal transduction histidine kinase